MAVPDQRVTFTDRCFKDHNGNRVLGQKPNSYQFVAWTALLASCPLSGKAGHIAALISYAAWFVWAVLELFAGVNYFRRLLGLGVLILLAVVAFR